MPVEAVAVLELLLLGCVECRLLLQMCAVSVCLSRGPTRLHFAKTAKRIKMLFGMNTLWGPRDIVLYGVLIPHREGGGPTYKFWNPLSWAAEAGDLKFWVHIEGDGS